MFLNIYILLYYLRFRLSIVWFDANIRTMAGFVISVKILSLKSLCLISSFYKGDFIMNRNFKHLDSISNQRIFVISTMKSF